MSLAFWSTGRCFGATRACMESGGAACPAGRYVIISASRANKKTAKVADLSIDLAECQRDPAL
ncbi:hypothetical protein C7S13_4173 [Burkholderia cepacia]|nr:hypothetical protein [Burkholderia cepacia]